MWPEITDGFSLTGKTGYFLHAARVQCETLDNLMQYYLGYLDLGAGSMLLQMILAGILGLGYTIKTHWRRIIGFFRRDKEGDSTTAESTPTDDRR